VIYIKKLLLILLFIPLIVCAQDTENYYGYSDLTIDYDFGTTVTMSGSGSLDYLKASLNLFPKESGRQEILSLNPSSNPNSKITEGDFIEYYWTEFSSNYEIGLASRVKTSNIIYKIEGIQFPIQDLDPELEEYTLPGETIDINDDIINQAQEIVAGETDLYSAVFKLADWTKKHIDYDLNTLTAKAALPSSWVLENGEGVCDEITSLFISFSRSVGIPARFVSGSAYTNVDHAFGNHGWAEVYFPGYGWVPYDVTFGEFGWLNPAHVDLFRSFDSSDAAIKYSWLGNGIDVNLGELSVEANVLSEGDIIEPVFDLNLDVLVDEVAPGSYVPFMVTVDNPYNKFTYDGVRISKVPSDVDELFKPVLLRPGLESNLFWIVRVPDNKPSGYIYTSTIESVDIFGSVSSDTFRFADDQGYKFISEEEAMEMISKLEEQEDKSYSDVLSLDCDPSKSYYYDFETVYVTCDVKNTGAGGINGLNICFKDDCKSISLSVDQSEEIDFEIIPNSSNLVFSAKNGDIELYSFVKISLLDEPDLSFSDISYPKKVDYDEEFVVKFTLSSKAKVDNLKLKLGSSKSFDIDKNEETVNIEASVVGKYFLTNKLIFKFDYDDEYGNSHSLEELKPIAVDNIPWYGKIIRGFKLILEKGKEVYYSL
jgi:transglutaminase-like putative cysteine protease